MLLQFRFQNYKSYKDECVIDLMASNEKSHEDHYVVINDQKILSTLSIYGNNASGKTTCLDAFYAMGMMVLNSLYHDNVMDFDIKPFQFSEETRIEPVTFEIFILKNGYEYQYGFTVNILENQIEAEWLYKKKFSKNKTKNQLLYERKRNHLITENKKLEELFQVIDSNVLFASFLGRRHRKGYDIIYEFFDHISTMGVRPKNIDYEGRVGKFLVENPNIQKQLEELLQMIDPCIQRLEIQKQKHRGLEEYKIYGVHKLNTEETTILPFADESDGTIKCIRLIPYILNAFAEGGLILVDEFDTRFHPLVYRKIISLFYDKTINIQNAQLIFSTHSTFLLNANDMRRDQILLVEKDKNGVSKLYTLDDFKGLRIDANYEKKYLAGEFGSIPFQNN